ncbi:MAG TPA: DNA-3-methyladenine glycosylase [Candidatus Binatia bacterium]|nr:DNA-3-methyladenine glycosylase [Candidatus Binatia bacterium]
MDFEKQLKLAVKHLAQVDPVMAKLIKQTPMCDLKPHKNYYWELIDSIISQQLSVKAAASIENRFQQLLGSKVPKPEAILAKSVEELRGVGLSRAKAGYIQDLAQKIIDGSIRFDRLDQKTNEEITNELVAVKGIGEWTAHMFLIFCVGRLDILPTGDLGIRRGTQLSYGLSDLPSPQQVAEVAESNRWHPYESVASWYIWRSLGNTPSL